MTDQDGGLAPAGNECAMFECAAFDEAALDGVAFDQAAFDEVAEHLSPAAVAGYLLGLATDAEALGCDLREAGEAGGDAALVEQAHRLAGSAGLLGFASIVAAARAFEAASDAKVTKKLRCAADLAAVLETSLPIMRQQLARFTAMTAVEG